MTDGITWAVTKNLDCKDTNRQTDRPRHKQTKAITTDLYEEKLTKK